MKAPQENTQEPQKDTVQRVQQEPSTGGEATIADNRPAIAVQRKLRSAMGGAEDTPNPIQRKNNTGLPDNLKSGIENLSGFNMGDVKVHYNSNKPAQLQAHAYAQGTDIHLAPGQEKHLPHEAWHVVQQKKGIVNPTMQLKGKVNINDDVGLEKEADIMGEKALQLKNKQPQNLNSSLSIQDSLKQTLTQRNNITDNFKAVQLKAKLSDKIDPNGFNVIGETHYEMEENGASKRKEEIKFVRKKEFFYYQETGLKVYDAKLKRVIYGDPVEPRIISDVFTVIEYLELVEMSLGYRERDLKDNKEKLLEELLGYFEKAIFYCDSQINIQWEKLHKDEREEKKDFKKIHESLLEDLKKVLKEVKNKIKIYINEPKNIVQLIAKWKTLLNPLLTKAWKLANEGYGSKIQYFGINTAIQKWSEMHKKRSLHMHYSANMAGANGMKGVWKIGNNHVNEILEMSDNEFDKQNYTLMTAEGFKSYREEEQKKIFNLLTSKKQTPDGEYL